MDIDDSKIFIQRVGRCLRTEKPQLGGLEAYTELVEVVAKLSKEKILGPEYPLYDALKEFALFGSKEKLNLVREFGRKEIDNGFIILDRRIRRMVYQMVSMILKENKLDILIPFSGQGALIDNFALNYDDSKIVSEESNDKAVKLQKKLFGAVGLNNIEVKNVNYLKEDFSREFDLILSQPPIGVMISPEDIGLLDWKSGGQRRMDIGQAYLIKSVEKLREGGILVGIVTPNILFSRTNQKLRNFLKKNMEILSIIETPKNVYNNFNRHAAVLVMRKKSSNKRNVNSIIMASFNDYNINSEEFETEYEKLINIWNKYLKEEIHSD